MRSFKHRQKCPNANESDAAFWIVSCGCSPNMDKQKETDMSPTNDGAEDARDAVWPVTWKQQGSYREVIQETLKWNGVPCFVTGRVWTHNNNWPLIDAAIASQAQEGSNG